MIKFLTSIIVAMALTLTMAVSGFAQFTCAQMEPVLVNTSSAWMKNVSGSACGTLASGDSRYFLLNANTMDQQLAVLLTAISLNKTLWVSATSDKSSGAVVNVTAIAK